MGLNRYVSIKGTKQGQFKGESSKGKPQTKWIEALACKYGVQSPVDDATGKATGKRTHDPLTITKQTGASSPQIYQAHWTSEILSEVVVEIRHPGTEAVVQRITLTNATISNLYTPKLLPHGVEHRSTNEFSNLEFVYQRIKVEGAHG